MKEKLFKGKYIVVVYDSEGYILDVANRPSEITCCPKATIQSMCSHILNGQKYRSVQLIDVTKIHNDCFEEEDKSFINFLNEIPEPKTNKKISIDLGISERTLYRWKAKYGNAYQDKLSNKKICEFCR